MWFYYFKCVNYNINTQHMHIVLVFWSTVPCHCLINTVMVINLSCNTTCLKRPPTDHVFTLYIHIYIYIYIYMGISSDTTHQLYERQTACRSHGRKPPQYTHTHTHIPGQVHDIYTRFSGVLRSIPWHGPESRRHTLEYRAYMVAVSHHQGKAPSVIWI